jgi:hypothetical protein
MHPAGTRSSRRDRALAKQTGRWRGLRYRCSPARHGSSTGGGRDARDRRPPFSPCSSVMPSSTIRTSVASLIAVVAFGGARSAAAPLLPSAAAPSATAAAPAACEQYDIRVGQWVRGQLVPTCITKRQGRRDACKSRRHRANRAGVYSHAPVIRPDARQLQRPQGRGRGTTVTAQPCCSAIERVRDVTTSPVCLVVTVSISTIQHSSAAIGLCRTPRGTTTNCPGASCTSPSSS